MTARVYVTSVIVAGAAVLTLRLPQAFMAQPVLFAGLVTLASLSAVLKVTLPLTTSGSTMSVPHAVDLASLLLLGPHATMIVATVGAFSQCHLNREEQSPLFRTLFSAASLVLTVQGTGVAMVWLSAPATTTMMAGVQPLVAATVYFLLYTGLVAPAIALSTREPIPTTARIFPGFAFRPPSRLVRCPLRSPLE